MELTDAMRTTGTCRYFSDQEVPDDVLPALREAGVSDAQVDQMMRLNPQAIFEHTGGY